MNKNIKKTKGVNVKNNKILLVRTGFILVLLLLWEYFASNGFYNPVFTSYPSEILKDLYSFLASGELKRHAFITLLESILGLCVGSFFGIVMAVLFGYFKWIGDLLSPIIAAISCIPQLALAPIYVIWFGIGLSSKIFLAGLMVFFNVFFATFGAIRGIDKGLIEAASLLGSKNYEILFNVVLPSCMPWIFSGLRGGIGAALVGAIIGEYMGAKGGFGWMITYSSSYFNIKRVMSCILILLLVGIFLNKVLDFFEKKILIWRTETSLSVDK